MTPQRRYFSVLKAVIPEIRTRWRSAVNSNSQATSDAGESSQIWLAKRVGALSSADSPSTHHSEVIFGTWAAESERAGDWMYGAIRAMCGGTR
jgi:hypothetical protein